MKIWNMFIQRTKIHIKEFVNQFNELSDCNFPEIIQQKLKEMERKLYYLDVQPNLIIKKISNEQHLQFILNAFDGAQICEAKISEGLDLLVFGLNHENALKIVKLSTGQDVAFTGEKHIGAVRCAAFSRGKRLMATGSSDSTIKIWDLQENTLLHTLAKHRHYVNSVRFSFDDTLVVSASYDGSVIVWSVDDGEDKFTLTDETSDMPVISCAVITSDNRTVVSASWDTNIRVWDCEREVRTKRIPAHEHYIRKVELTFYEKYIVSGSDDKTIKVWDLETSELVHEIGFTDWVYDFAILPDQKTILAVSGRSIIICNILTPDKIKFKPGFNEINKISITESGSSIVTTHQLGKFHRFELVDNFNY